MGWRKSFADVRPSVSASRFASECPVGINLGGRKSLEPGNRYHLDRVSPSRMHIVLELEDESLLNREIRMFKYG